MDIEILSEFLEYDPSVPGCLKWRKKPSSKTVAGSQAGSFQKKRGYYYVTLHRRKYLSHRVIWALCNGSLPDGMDIDHIDMDSSNNRIENLRQATRSENHMNRRVRPNNKTGIKGLSKHAGGWDGRIQVNGKTHRKFSKSREVIEKWLLETRPNLHGEFTRHS